MKRLYVTAVIAGAMFFSVESATAQVYENSQGETPAEQTQQAEYRQIEVQELPAEVQQAVERDHAGATIAEAHVKEKEGEQTFKLKVTTAEGEEHELFADAQGNWIEKDEKDSQ